MEVFDSKPPTYTEQETAKIAEKYFNKSGDIKMLVSERDQNARISTSDGEYVLKIANSAEDPQNLEFQNAVLNHVSTLDPTLAIPKVIKGHDGNDLYTHGNNKIRLITFLKGEIFGDAVKSDALYADLGRFLGRFSNAMQGFGHPQAHQPDFLWNLDNALFSRQYITDIVNDDDKELITWFYDRYEALVLPRLQKMRSAVIHSDANTYNIVVQGDKISGLIDFGDMLFAKQVNELAIALGYAVLDVDDIYAVSNALIKNYTAEFTLSEDELEVLFDLAAMRLVMSVCISSNRVIKASDDKHREYLLVTQAPALKALKRLRAVGMNFLSCFARKAGGFDAVASLSDLKTSLAGQKFSNLFDFDLTSEPRVLFDNAEGAPGTEHILDPHAHAKWVREFLDENDARYGIGNYGENRTSFKIEGIDGVGSPEPRTTHLAIDIWLRAPERIYAPLDGVVHSIATNSDPFDFGTLLIIKHKIGNGPEFYTLYGHLASASHDLVKAGDIIISRRSYRHTWRDRRKWWLGTPSAFSNYLGLARMTQAAISREFALLQPGMSGRIYALTPI